MNYAFLGIFLNLRIEIKFIFKILFLDKPIINK